MNNQTNQKKKKKGSGAWGLVILALVWLFNRVNGEDISRFFSRLRWMFRTGRLSSPLLPGIDGERIGALCAGALLLVVLVLVVVRVSRAAKEKRFEGVTKKPGAASGGGTSAAHSHDRLQGYTGNESGAEHWKKQLDGFLAAGIIDRGEYRVLLERRRK